jgi:hypothetical protein
MVGSALAECLVGLEAHDGQTEWVHGKLIVLHGNTGRPSLPLEFGMVAGLVYTFSNSMRAAYGGFGWR